MTLIQRVVRGCGEVSTHIGDMGAQEVDCGWDMGAQEVPYELSEPHLGDLDLDLQIRV